MAGLMSLCTNATDAAKKTVYELLLWGAICLDGIVIGVSGAHPWYDEAFALAIAGWFRAEAKRAAAEAGAAGVLFTDAAG